MTSSNCREGSIGVRVGRQSQRGQHGCAAAGHGLSAVTREKRSTLLGGPVLGQVCHVLDLVVGLSVFYAFVTKLLVNARIRQGVGTVGLNTSGSVKALHQFDAGVASPTSRQSESDAHTK